MAFERWLNSKKTLAAQCERRIGSWYWYSENTFLTGSFTQIVSFQIANIEMHIEIHSRLTCRDKYAIIVVVVAKLLWPQLADRRELTPDIGLLATAVSPINYLYVLLYSVYMYSLGRTTVNSKSFVDVSLTFSPSHFHTPPTSKLQRPTTLCRYEQSGYRQMPLFILQSKTSAFIYCLVSLFCCSLSCSIAYPEDSSDLWIR
jgi:hypothetical protein